MMGPHNTNALHELGLLAIQEGRHEAAVEYLRRAVGAAAEEADLHCHLGVALGGLKRFPEAVACFEQAIEIDPRSADAHYNLGNALRATGELDGAVTHYRAALGIHPDAAEVHFNLANTLRDLGRLNEAVAGYQQAVRVRPSYVKAYNNLGNVLRDQGKLEEAAAVHRQAIRIKPDYAEGYHNLGVVLASQGKFEEAAASYRTALRLKPGFLAARNSLGKALTELGRLDEAMQVLQSASEQDETSLEAQLRLAEKLRSEGRFDEAIACIENVLRTKSDLAVAHNNLGLVWLAKGEPEQAVESYHRALGIKPDFAEAHSNLAIALHTLRDFAGGMKHIEMALRIKPDFAVAHLNRSVTWLRLGDFERGWHEFEWRRLCEGHRIRELPAPLWDGRPLGDRALLLHAEQGLGDTIQFVRYARLVKQRCGRVIVQCHKALKQLLARCPGVDHLAARGETLPSYEAQAPLMSLPLILGTTLATVPREVPYVFVADELTAGWRSRLSGYDGFKIGIAWQGNPRYAGDPFRSVPLRQFARLARVPGVRLFSLQRGNGSEQLAGLAEDFEIVDFGPEFDKTSGRFMDSAAVIKSLDLVISSDTSVVHLAGAMAVPVWVALTYTADWRWLDRRDDSPWYPTMRFFRQPRLGDWDGVFRRIAEQLEKVVHGGAEKLPPADPCPAFN